MQGKSAEIRDHKWFSGEVDWQKVYAQTMPAPHVPNAVNPLDIAFKNPTKHEEPLKITKANPFRKEFIDF